MMGYTKLCLLLLLSRYTLAQEGTDVDDQTSACLLASRFKAYKKYVYQYTTESRNGVVGTANLRNGPKVSCQVEIEIPQTCRFIMRTRDCVLSEVSIMDPQGQPVYRQSPGSEAFQAAMEKNPLMFTVEDITTVHLYPETDEPVNILNIKRGIVSTLIVPVMEDEQNSLMSTVHGQCLTENLVNGKDITTDLALSRDLSQCDHFYSRELAGSPLALLQKLHRPMSKLITSTQDCNYRFDKKGKHIVTAMCTEKHIYLPFSHKDNGISSVVIQDLSFQSSKRINNRVFDVNPSQSKPLHFEDPDNKAPVQTKDTVLSSLKDLVALAGTDQGQKRTSLFHKLVSSLRVLRNDTLSQMVTEMLDMSGWLTYQALFQCGTPECTSAILQAIRTIDGVSLEVDALVYGLSLQADPDAARVRDMLSMAQYKQSRAIMYSLANTVKKFHKGEVTPVVTDVSKFMETLLNDCLGESLYDDSDFPTDPDDMSFLVLRVVGVMGKAMQVVSPSLISSILRCAKKTDIPLSNQKAAIQAFRLMDINDEVKNALMEVYQDTQSSVEKRIAAYLILMKNPHRPLVQDIVNSLENVKNEQLKSFVISHLNNIRNFDEPQMHQLREHIELTLKKTKGVLDGMSHNYKINSPLGSVQSNIIFDGRDTLPKEVMLETTLKVFDYNYDMFEVSVEGTGFEPTIDALFGKKGFFPDSISRVMYWAGDKAQMLKDVLDRISPNRERMKRQVPQDLLKDLTDNARKLMDDVRFSQAPEAIAYLRLLGNEIGYLKTSEIRKMAETLSMYYHVFIRILPMKALFSLISSTENEVFAHYIFMESAFSLPTASGFPLKFSLAGVFAPGVKGGLTHSGPNIMTDLSFMPSVGLEFITEMGVHIPDYVEAGLEMHTNMYHESSINAKITVNRNQLRLSIPAPKSNTKLLSVSNKLLSVSSGQTKMVPSLVEDSTGCEPLFSGLKLCTILRYSNATSMDQAPYYPLTGETSFAVEIQPTGEISEYTATITDETLREGKKGHHKVHSLKLTLKAEGDDSTETTASLKYNQNKNILTAEVVIPDYDVEAAIKLSVTDSDAKGKKMRGITIDVTNRNIPQLTLVGRTRLQMMRDAILQLQMVIPSLKTDVSVTGTLKKDEDVFMDLETMINLPETSYQQRASLKYDDDKLEVELKSELNSEIQKLIPDVEEYHGQLHQLINDILDQKVARTDMKLRHIVTKGIEAGNIWLDKLTARIPYLANLRSKRSMSDLTLPALPEKLFLQSDSLFRYQFNKDKMAISLPLPLGGKKLEELNIPTTLSIPHINLPEIGLYVPAKKYPLPSITIPPSLDFNIPLLGLAEASTKINSNFYQWEGSISGGNSTFDVPSYIVQYKAMAQSPLNLLSYKFEGTGMMSGRADDNLKYLLNSSFSHSLIDTSFSALETLRVTNKLNAQANYKIEASSPVGLQASIYYSAQSTSTLDSDEVSGDGTMNGLLKIGSFCTNTSYTNSFNLRPLDREGRGESTLHFDSPFIQVQNIIHGDYANSELNIVSKTNAQRDILKHVAELKYKDAQLTLKWHAIATGTGKVLNNKVELGVSSRIASLAVESQADDDTNRVYSLVTGSLDSNGLKVHSEGSLTFDAGRGLHKASVMVGRNGLTTSGVNSILCSSVTVENIFNGTIDNNGASLSSTTKAMAEESRGELNIEGKVTAAEASLYGVLKGHAYDATTRNNMNIALNRRAMTFTSNTIGTLKQMKTENSHTLTLSLWTLALRSKTNNFICEDIYYKQDTNVDMKPFVMSLDMANDLKFYDVSLSNEGHMKLEPIKVDLSGSIKGVYGEEHNITHTYKLTYDDMAGTMKYSMSGDVMGAQLSSKCEVQFAGLSSTSDCEAHMKSELLHFDSTIRTMALPFSFTIDALVNSDGEINLYGKHNGQLYSKLLVKAEPLALAYSHDNRVSTTHMLPSWESSINVDNKFDGLLAPSDQYLTWKLKSTLNEHAYNQDVRTYNNPEKIGFEFSGAILTDFFSKLSKNKRLVPEIQEYSMAGFLKYDKNSDCHIIEIPFIKSLPYAFEQLKSTLVKSFESLQQFINNLEINQIIANFRAKLDWIPIQVSNFMQDMDLENKVNQIKAKLDYLIGEFAVTIDDLELVMNNLSKNFENTVMDIATKIRNLILTIKDYLKAGHLTIKITNVLSKIGNQLQEFDEKYEIKQSLVKALHAIEDIIRQTDLQKLTKSSTAWLQELDSKYKILEKIKHKLSVIKKAIENFDVKMFFQDVKDYLLSFNLAIYVEQLSYKIPSSEIAKVIESMNDVIVNWIDEYEIPNKLNAVFSYIRDLFLKYKLDDNLKELMDQIVILIKELKIEETVQSVADALKSINFEFFYGKIMQFLHDVTTQLRATDIKKSIVDLNEQISSTLKSMKEFDYSAFVDETNKKIVELTNYINEQIKTYEIVQKIEAVRDFFREIQNSIFTYLAELKNTKVADALKKLKNVIETTLYNDIKMKVQDILDDMRQRIVDMDIRDEMYIHLQRASESYRNMVAYISVQFNRLIETIRKVSKDNKIITQMKQAVDDVLGAFERPEIEIGTFTVPFTDLVIPAFTVNLNKLQEISIPAQISVPEFTIFNSYTIPAFTIDFDEIKAKIVAIIDDYREFEIKIPDLQEIFGDLKVLYLSELPDLSFPEITLSEIKFPAINIPKLNLEDFRITMLIIPEIKLPEVPNDTCIPVFGKVHGEFRVDFPQYTLVTAGKIENSTSTPKNPQFTATITSHAKSPIEPLEYTFEATAQLEAPRMKRLLFTETVKAEHMAFSIDHEGSLTLTGSSAEASAKTTTKATTQMYTADLVNNMTLALKSGISASIDTAYKHNLDIPSIETSNQASVNQNIAATMESGKITVTGETTGNGKWSIKDYSDGGMHTSSVDFNINFSTAKLFFVGETDCKALKLKQTLTAESVILSHITIEARCEIEVPSVKKSVMILNGKTHMGDLEIALTASHDAEFTGSLIGSMSNSLEFMAHPFEVVLDVKNQVNSKIFLPLKLTGKVDLLNDYGVLLNSEKQYACWFALARFNQYKYNHNFTAANNEMDIFFHTSANAEANLDFLTVPLSFPKITVPYLEIKTPEVRHLSLWEQAGFKTLLTTPQQSFDMNLKLHYYKNPDMHSIELYLEPIYNTISVNADIIQAQFEQYRDKVVAFLKNSYNQAKSQKHKIDTSSLPPRIFTVPGYKIPILNIDVSAFRAEMPAFNYFVPKEVSTPSFKVPALGFSVPSYTLVLPSLEFPAIHVPETLSEIKLPTLTQPAIQNNIVIPAMGNITCDFSFKSTMITLSANAGLYNQSDIVARFGASSTSVFDILNGKFDGTTSMTRKKGIKLATTLSMEHNNVEVNHESAVSLIKRSMETSVANTAKIILPFLNLELNQELIGNIKTKLKVVSKKKIKYMFNIPLFESVGKGGLDMNWALEALNYVSLETSTQGKSDIMIMRGFNFSGDLENEASFYLNANHLRSTVRTFLNSNINKQEKQKRSSNNDILQFDLNKDLALEVSLRRVFATVHYMSNNNIDLASFNTNGRHIVKGQLDFVPLTNFKTTLNIDASQPSSLGHAGLIQSINLAISSEKQSLAWSYKEQLASLIHACDLFMSNDESQVRMDLTGSVEGHLAFLKAVRLPMYQKTLWDVFKFDQVTNMDNLQFLNMSCSIAYTKTMDGQEYAIPSKLFENGITFSIPEITIAVPSWVKEIPHSIRNMDMRFENADVPDHITLPPVISIPAFYLPFTNLHVESFTIDPKNLNIPKVITTTAFDIMLPGLPIMSVPSCDINIGYAQGKMSFHSFKIPQYEITVSSFTLPKTFAIGEYTISLNEITSQIANFELPTIIIPEQKIEIPEMALHLPSSVFIPVFGALSANLKVFSPIYNVSTIANMEKKGSSLVTSLNSISTSTMIFLEYDLSGSATLGFDNGVINLNGKWNLIHSDVNVNLQHGLAQNLRESPYSLTADITSQTFTDVSFRFASRKDGITATMSSPSSGFLGLHFQQRSPSQLYGKLFSRHPSTPDKDTDVFTAKATLRNSEKLILQTSWNWDFLHDIIEGTKDRIPTMTNAVLKFLNKYHTTHFGFDLNRGSMKLKNTVSNIIERVHHGILMCFNTIQSSVKHLGDQGRNMYRKASDSLMSMSVEDVIDRSAHEARQVLKRSEDKIYVFIDAVTRFLSDMKFKVPGSEERLSSLEIFQQARLSVSRTIDRAIQRLTSLMDNISRLIRSIEFTIPGTYVAVNGNEIMDKLKFSTRSIYDQLIQSLRRGFGLLQKAVNNVFQVIAEKGENFIIYLKDENVEITSEVDVIYAEFLQSTKEHIEEAKRHMVDYNNLTKLRLQEAYNALNMECINNNTKEFISILQSHLYGGLNEGVDLMRRTSQSTAPYITVSSKKTDIEIPLPFLWKSFNEWPVLSRQ
ncbi:apolipoprotein B-100 isoform X2 [Trachinotus anak]|uniref:apolipoprotein B-100 isoform X2 n=1 Tax=Trachinotus anak TaxID=443729 RepID=UPI0039F1B41E